MNGIRVMDFVQVQKGRAGVAAMQGKYVMLNGRADRTGDRPERTVRNRYSSRPVKPAGDDSVYRTAGRTGRSFEYRGHGHTEPAGKQNIQKNIHGRSGKKRANVPAVFSLMRGVVLCMVFVCMVTGFGMMIRASSRPKEQLWKYYTTVQTGSDHDLDDIVRENMNETVYSSADDYVREVCEINSLPYKKGSLPDLKPGSVIVIPYHSTELK